ncbi:hypothetical protein CAEBREN_22780 [Caenorhabditis brenneri]|uniref:Uncharacterized protein n=1 Tax=Caenorhabditis brenneri TaxID=135651 RepID=G0NCB4_CAEBE|nr:hypothetical protein CAEBREN_22780 [Caenorhabditis brenneri]
MLYKVTIDKILGCDHFSIGYNYPNKFSYLGIVLMLSSFLKNIQGAYGTVMKFCLDFYTFLSLFVKQTVLMNCEETMKKCLNLMWIC